MRTHLVSIIILSSMLVLSAAATGVCQVEIAELRSDILKSDSPKQRAIAYKKLFEKIGKQNLGILARDPDLSISLQASWETHKRLVKRSLPVKDRVDDIYDRDELTAFCDALKKKIDCPIPEWWLDNFTNIDVVPGKLHFIGKMSKEPILIKGKAGGLVRENTQLAVKDNLLTIRKDNHSVTLNKLDIDLDKLSPSYVYDAAWMGEISVVMAYNSIAGTRYGVSCYQKGSEKPKWTASVWAVNRTELNGNATHKAELIITKNVVYIFGSETNGMYVEAFDIATGKPVLRFSTCYWFHFSEAWIIK